MIISPAMLKEQIFSRVSAVLQRFIDSEITLDTLVPVTSWEVMKQSSSRTDFFITSVWYHNNKRIDLVLSSGRKDLADGSISWANIKTAEAHSLNIEDVYNLYTVLSNELTTVSPSYVETSDEA
jgi:hypothetical protein